MNQLEFDYNINSQEEYESLLRSLQWTDGFGLFFVTCFFEQVDNLFQDISKKLTDKKVKLLSLENKVDNLYEIVNSFLEKETVNILIIRGLEYSLYTYEEEIFKSNYPNDRYIYSWQGVSRILGHLNLQRERFRDNFPISFIFCLPQFALNYFIRRAPDFFDWRSGVFALESYLGDCRQYQKLRQSDIDVLLSVQNYFSEQYRIFYTQSLQFLLLNQYELCLKMIDQVLAIQPDSYECLYLKAQALDRLSRKDEANYCYSKILDLKIDNSWKWDKAWEILAEHSNLIKWFNINYFNMLNELNIDVFTVLSMAYQKTLKYINSGRVINNFSRWVRNYFNFKIIEIYIQENLTTQFPEVTDILKNYLDNLESELLNYEDKNYEYLVLEEAGLLFQSALAKLDAEDAELIKLHYLENLAIKEIQQKLSNEGKSYALSTISGKISRALNKFISIMKQETL